jgi:hypothetical protein
MSKKIIYRTDSPPAILRDINKFAVTLSAKTRNLALVHKYAPTIARDSAAAAREAQDTDYDRPAGTAHKHEF